MTQKNLVMQNNKILCHIVGMNEDIKIDFLNLMKTKKNQVRIVDLDKSKKKIINEQYLEKLKKKADFLRKRKNKKYKEIEEKMKNYWQKKLQEYLNNILKNIGKKKLIIIGLVTHNKYKQ